MKVRLLIIFPIIFLLGSIQVFGQKKLVFVDYATEKPIPSLNVRYPNRLLITDSLGRIFVPDSIKKLTVSGINYELRQVACAAFDTIYLFAKPVVYEGVVISKPYKKPKLWWKRYNNMGLMLGRANDFYRVNISKFDERGDSIKFQFDASKLNKLPDSARIKLIIKSVNKNWKDTATLLSVLDDTQLQFFNKLDDQSKYVTDQLIFEREYSVNEIKDKYLTVPIDSIAKLYNEVFLSFGLIHCGRGKYFEEVGMTIRSQNASTYKLSIETTTGVVYPYMYLMIRQQYVLDKLLIPYFELVKGKMVKK